eukprot:TRINITY_DN26702_c0_g1_i1.p1 TRINITY_DN26702_c0_g1~~TRINITY_DN26702_c0_g1_i1.p1  ORF type:complete len:562 (+),score=73.39 TRINITY_DN26702_c0_g1_i1:60-1745(+)
MCDSEQASSADVVVVAPISPTMGISNVGSLGTYSINSLSQTMCASSTRRRNRLMTKMWSGKMRRRCTVESLAGVSSVASIATTVTTSPRTVKILSDKSETAAPSTRLSRSAFDSCRTEEEDKSELRSVFVHAEELAAQKTGGHKCSLERLRGMTAQEVNLLVESSVCVLIILNALFIGFSMDMIEEHRSLIINFEVVFTVTFILELFLKLGVSGFKQHFTGDTCLMNAFDALLIVLDLIQLGIQLSFQDAPTSVRNLPQVSLFRIVRFVRLARILRLLRHPVLETFLMMMHGIVGGLPTLGCALCLFAFSVYLVALMSREVLGRHSEDEHIYEYFYDVPRAMVTTFRCSFGECSTIDGTPIFEHVDAKYGIGFSLMYCLFAFSMSIGMFNVISAIFIQSTLEAGAGIVKKHKKARLQDDELWASRINIIVRKIAQDFLEVEPSDKLSEYVEDIYNMDISNDDIDCIGADPEVKKALGELDVDPEDHECLSEILDVDQNGSVAVIELLQAIKRLRGDPRRSDLVTVDLLCRSIQNTLKEVQQVLLQSLHPARDSILRVNGVH